MRALAARASTGGLGRSVESRSRRRGDICCCLFPQFVVVTFIRSKAMVHTSSMRTQVGPVVVCLHSIVVRVNEMRRRTKLCELELVRAMCHAFLVFDCCWLSKRHRAFCCTPYIDTPTPHLNYRTVPHGVSGWTFSGCDSSGAIPERSPTPLYYPLALPNRSTAPHRQSTPDSHRGAVRRVTK